MEIKFTTPKDSNGEYEKRNYEDAEVYCKKEYLNGRLARSDSFGDWESPDSIKLVSAVNELLQGSL